MRRARWSGFTLTELLVVVGIVALLAALLFPVLARARQAAHAARYTTNLHQLALAFRMYLQDYDGIFPPNGIVRIRDVRQVERLWYRQIQPYFRDRELLHCPADIARDARRALSAALPEAYSREDLPALSYGVNRDLVKAAADRRPEGNVAALRFETATLLVADCTEPWAFGPVYSDPEGVHWSHIAYANGPPVSAAADPYFHGGRSDSNHERHRTGSYVAFIDGYVAFLPAAKLARYGREEPPGLDGQVRRVPVPWPLVSPEAVPPD